MPGDLHDFGPATSVDAEAIGPPGQRRFRLVIQNEQESAALWLEKEQLAAVATALDQQLARTRSVDTSPRRPEDDEGSPIPLNPSLDLQVGQLALGYDDARQLFMIQIYAVDAGEGGQATLTCGLRRDQARRIIRQVTQLMQTGRPVCPLCGATLQGPHVCPRSNGHSRVAIQ